MKGGVLGYGAIIAVLITGSLVLIHIAQVDPVTAEVATTEGMLTSFGNFNHLFLRTFNQSIEFISQRSAYDLGQNGGLRKGDSLWNYYYPSMSTLERELEEKIKETLPSSYIKGKRIVTMEDIYINIRPEQPLVSSSKFIVEGEANFSIYDEEIRTRTFLQHNVNSTVNSSYFKLLYAGRAILEEVVFNSTLNDVNNLLLLLRNDPRFKNILEFDIIVVGDILDITIEEVCYPSDTHCLAPLNPGEPGGVLDLTTGDPTRYDTLKLNFKVFAEQTGLTPPVCDFDISIVPTFDDVEAGDNKTALVIVGQTGTIDDTVTLSVDSIVNSTGNPDSTITVTFNPSIWDMPFNSIMKMETSSLTLADIYTITVRGDSCGGAETRTATYDLTVNPSMTFIIVANPNTDTVVRGNSVETFVNVHKIAGPDRIVDLFIDNIVPDPLGGITATFVPELIPPDFDSKMTISTFATVPAGVYTITVRGVGGGSTDTDVYWLTVELPFDFDLLIAPASDSIYPTQSSSPTVTVDRTQGTPEAVTVSLVHIISKTTMLPDPSGDDFNITVDLSVNNPCTPLGPVFECYPGMTIFTNEYTPPDDYEIKIEGTSASAWDEVTFDLTVNAPECIPPDPAMCGPPTHVCKYYTCVGFVCIENNQDDDYIPPGPDGIVGTPDDPCGFRNCDDKCELDSGDGQWKEYRNPTGPCNVECDGGGKCDTSCDPGACTYGTITICDHGCDGISCAEYEFDFELTDTCYAWDPDCKTGNVYWSEDEQNCFGFLPTCSGKNSDGVEWWCGACRDEWFFDGSYADDQVSGRIVDWSRVKSASTAYIWQSIGDVDHIGVSRTAECCWMDTFDGEESCGSRWAGGRSYPLEKYPYGILDEADRYQPVFGLDWPYSNWRKAWCGDENINCLLCADYVDALHMTAWFVCKFQEKDGMTVSDLAPYGVILMNPGDSWTDALGDTWTCQNDGNWI